MNEARVNKMLAAVPVGSCTDSLHMWQRMKPLTARLLESYWDKVERNQPFYDFENATFTKWTDRKGRHIGMRDRTTDLRQGIVRSFDK